MLKKNPKTKKLPKEAIILNRYKWFQKLVQFTSSIVDRWIYMHVEIFFKCNFLICKHGALLSMGSKFFYSSRTICFYVLEEVWHFLAVRFSSWFHSKVRCFFLFFFLDLNNVGLKLVPCVSVCACIYVFVLRERGRNRQRQRPVYRS